MGARRRVVDVVSRRSAPVLGEIRVRVVHDAEDPGPSHFDSGDPEYRDQDTERRAQYERGELTLVGVVAEADVVVEGVGQRLTSGGLWGVESDSGAEYVEEVALQEYDKLREILKAVGVPTSQVPVGDRDIVRPLIQWEA